MSGSTQFMRDLEGIKAREQREKLSPSDVLSLQLTAISAEHERNASSARHAQGSELDFWLE